MTWSPEDVTDLQADWCIEQHTEPRLDCPYCPTRAELKVCARCDEEIWPTENCPTCVDLPALVVDGFGRAMVTRPSESGDVTGVRAA